MSCMLTVPELVEKVLRTLIAIFVQVATAAAIGISPSDTWAAAGGAMFGEDREGGVGCIKLPYVPLSVAKPNKGFDPKLVGALIKSPATSDLLACTHPPTSPVRDDQL